MEVAKIEVPDNLPVLSNVFLDPAGRYLMGTKPDGAIVTVAELIVVSSGSKRGRKPKTIGERKKAGRPPKVDPAEAA